MLSDKTQITQEPTKKNRILDFLFGPKIIFFIIPLLITVFLASYFFSLPQKVKLFTRTAPPDTTYSNITQVTNTVKNSKGFEDIVVTSYPTPTIHLIGNGDLAPTYAYVAVPKVYSHVIYITAENNRFSPNFFSMFEGNNINIHVKAIDHDYDLTIPDADQGIFIKKGEEQMMPLYGRKPRELMFLCAQQCQNDPESRGIIKIISKS
jgi:hypothetical protein